MAARRCLAPVVLCTTLIPYYRCYLPGVISDWSILIRLTIHSLLRLLRSIYNTAVRIVHYISYRTCSPRKWQGLQYTVISTCFTVCVSTGLELIDFLKVIVARRKTRTFTTWSFLWMVGPLFLCWCRRQLFRRERTCKLRSSSLLCILLLIHQA